MVKEKGEVNVEADVSSFFWDTPKCQFFFGQEKNLYESFVSPESCSDSDHVMVRSTSTKRNL